LSGSFKGIAFGILLAFLASWLLFWNEGRAVRRYQALSEGQGVVIPISSDRVDPANEGKLVHLSGEATTEEFLTDDQFGVRVSALHLRRTVEMFQWAELQNSETRDVEGNQTETVTTYSYAPRWSVELIESARFHEPAGHENPAGFPVASRLTSARDVRIGTFRLSEGQVKRIDQFAPLDIPQTAQLQGDLRWRARLLDGGVYLGRNPASPAIGDVKIRFERVPFTSVSIVARQVGGTFEPFFTSSGETVELLRRGVASPEAMFQSAQEGNRINTWLLRLVGLVIMYFGVGKVLRPMVVAVGIIPAVGDAVASGTRLISLLLAAAFSLVVIAAGWIYYRPLLAAGILLLAAATAVVFLLLLRKATSTASQAAAA
jgi:hypothetical protein